MMKIAGIQKLTLLDFPGRCAATIFTPGCDLRCPFCHNASLVDPGSIHQAEEEGTFIDPRDVLAFLKERFGRLTGLAVTGGEPLMQEGLTEFLLQAKAIGYAVKLDTNGTYPDRLRDIIASKAVDYIAMDLKNSRSRYGETTGLPNDAAEKIFDNTIKSMQIMIESSIDHEFRTTVSAQLHEEKDIREIAALISEIYKKSRGLKENDGNEECSEKFFLQSFTDSGDILNGSFSAHSRETMERMLQTARQFVPLTQLRGI